MGKITDGLDGSFEEPVLEFIEQKGEEDRDRKTEYDGVDAYQKGIAQQSGEKEPAEKLFEVDKADPRASPDPPAGRIILESDYQPVHREVCEHNKVNDNRQYHQDKKLIAPYVL